MWDPKRRPFAKFAGTKHLVNIMGWQVATVAEDFSRGAFEGE